MRRLAFAALTATSGCAASDLELDHEAAASADLSGKADDASVGLQRLERATPTQVTSSFKLVRGADLAQCFAGYQSTFDAGATKLTKAVTDQFIKVSIQTSDAACADWFDLGEIVNGVLEMKGLTEATPSTIIDAMPLWAKPKLTAATVAGYVDLEKAPLLFYDDITRVRLANAMAREQDPTGIDLAQLRSQWNMVRESTTLDRTYLNPVTFRAGALEGSDIFKNLRAAFPLRGLSLVSTGLDAVSDFAAASEGPDGDSAFGPIGTALKKSSIRKRFYYSRQGSWSSNVLIVIDEHGQAWGMQMGYSE